MPPPKSNLDLLLADPSNWGVSSIGPKGFEVLAGGAASPAMREVSKLMLDAAAGIPDGMAVRITLWSWRLYTLSEDDESSDPGKFMSVMPMTWQPWRWFDKSGYSWAKANEEVAAEKALRLASRMVPRRAGDSEAPAPIWAIPGHSSARGWVESLLPFLSDARVARSIGLALWGEHHWRCMHLRGSDSAGDLTLSSRAKSLEDFGDFCPQALAQLEAARLDEGLPEGASARVAGSRI